MKKKLSIIFAFLAAAVAHGAATDVEIAQRNVSDRNEFITITGSSNPWEAIGFNASGILGPITLFEMMPSGTALQVLRRNAANTGLEFATAAAGLGDADYGDITVSGSGTVMSIDANSVALGTDTTGNFVASIADSGASEITVTGSGAESAAVTLAIASTLARDSEVAAGYQPLDADLTAIAGLADPNADRILFWDESSNAYAQLTVGGGLSITGTTIAATGSGSGDVSKVGTPVNNQVGVWTGDGTLEGDANLTFDTATDTLTTGIITVTDLNTTNLNAGNLVFEGATADAFETTLTVVDPTADRTWTFPDATDTVVGLAATQTLTNKTISLTSNTVTATSAELRTAVSDETGTGAAVFAGGDIGAATATTPAADDNDTSVATTAYVQTEISGLGGGGTLASMRTTSVVWDEMMYTGNIGTTLRLGPFGWGTTVTGTSAAVASQSAHLANNLTGGMLAIESGTQASTSYAGFNTDVASLMFNTTTPTTAYDLEFRIWLPSANVQTASTDDYVLRLGFIDISGNTASVIDGAWFEYTSADTEWQIKTASNTSNVSTADSGVTVAEDTWIRLTISVNAAADSIGFSINGTPVTGSPLTTTANIPRTAGRFTGIGVQNYKVAGSTEATCVIDYMGLQMTYGTSR